ncbi:MAG: mechanosensitive ion channel [Bacteroidales bacterium]|nr:mechanosensitive ion channel [Bacteroidales bacterium]
MKPIIVLVIVTATYFVLKFLQVVIKRFGKKYFILKTVGRMLPLIVSVTWVVIVFWSANYLFNEKSYYKLVIICMIVILSVLIGWFFIKDFIAGVIFRVQNNYAEGDHVQFGEVAGRVESLYLTHISLQTQEGRLVKVPYSRLGSEIISQKTESKTFEKNSFILKTRKTESVTSTEESIRNILMTSPWRISNTQPNIKFVGEDDLSFHYNILVQVRNQKHLDYLAEALDKRFGQLSGR